MHKTKEFYKKGSNFRKNRTANEGKTRKREVKSHKNIKVTTLQLKTGEIHRIIILQAKQATNFHFVTQSQYTNW